VACWSEMGTLLLKLVSRAGFQGKKGLQKTQIREKPTSNLVKCAKNSIKELPVITLRACARTESLRSIDGARNPLTPTNYYRCLLSGPRGVRKAIRSRPGVFKSRWTKR